MREEFNKLITQTGSNTKMGRLLRQYWQPVALADELEKTRPIHALRVMGQDLILFRDNTGRLGLIDRHCAHRGADLCYGRLEDGGVRCPFHGWLYDVQGQCLEQPAEPADSEYHLKVHQPAYPCAEINGVIFAWLGEGEAPPMPDLDCLRAPSSHSFAFKGMMACNWLQALEVGIDPAHASWLHRYLEDDNTKDAYGKQFRDGVDGTNIPVTQILRDFPRPDIKVEETPYGMRLITLRELNNSQTHVRVTNQIFPQAITIPMSDQMNITQWHVPVTDTCSYWYAMFTSFEDPVDHALMRAQRLEQYDLPGYTPKRNASNQYGFDPEEQRTRTFTGMGDDINVHDQWAVESPGPIQDRTREHLGTTDIAIIAHRRRLQLALTALDNGECLPQYQRAMSSQPVATLGPPAIDTIAPTAGWQDHWRQAERDRRHNASWTSESF